MRIGLISPCYYPNVVGGSEVSARLLAQGLIKKGHDVVIISFDKIDKKEPLRDNDDVKIVRYRSFYPKEPFNLICSTIRAMKKWENCVDLFHVYDVFPMPGAGLYRILGGKKKVVATLNNYNGFCPVNLRWGECQSCDLPKRFKCLSRELTSIKGRMVQIPYSILHPILIKYSKVIDKYIALSEGVKRLYVMSGYDEKKIEIVPNFIDPNFLNYSNTNLLDLKCEMKDTFTILYVGRMSSEKGVELLIKAFSYLSKKHEHIRLIMVGDGPRLANLIDLADKNDRISLIGKVDYKELLNYYSLADVFVHPAIQPEPFGRTILEALSFGIPLIVSDVGAPPEIARSSALIFKSGDISSLIEKLDLIINDEGLKKKLKSNCSEILKDYGQTVLLKKIIELYDRILES